MYGKRDTIIHSKKESEQNEMITKGKVLSVIERDGQRKQN